MSRKPVDDEIRRHRLHARLTAAVRSLPAPPPTPVAVVDLDAFDANAADLARRAAGKPIRVASKSLRVPELVRRALAADGFSGVLGYKLAEALWLAEQGISDDVVMGYPSVDRPELARLAESPELAGAVTLMVDDVAQLDLVDSVRGSSTTSVRVALDVDAALRLGPAAVGPKRSPLFSVPAVLALAREVVDRPGFALVGVMTYEGQVAGVPDSVPTQRARSAAVRRIKWASVRQLADRRAAIAEALDDLVKLEFWNAGGSGSIETSCADPVVTEVTAGSGLLVPALFDHYRSFEPRPAAFFGLPVVRRPAQGVVTVAGGGLIASGATGADRSPVPWAPPGLALTPLEGAGEVQTPLAGPGAAGLSIGDLVWFRHAKSGELAEHVNTVHLLAGRSIVESVPSYRGCGRAW